MSEETTTLRVCVYCAGTLKRDSRGFAYRKCMLGVGGYCQLCREGYEACKKAKIEMPRYCHEAIRRISDNCAEALRRAEGEQK